MVVVLPLPLTPITRITCGRGKAVDVDLLRHRAQDRGDLLGDRLLQFLLGDVEAEALLGQLGADARGGGGAEVGQDQRILDIVERRIVELRGADRAGEVFERRSEVFLKPPKIRWVQVCRSLQQAFLELGRGHRDDCTTRRAVPAGRPGRSFPHSRCRRSRRGPCSGVPTSELSQACAHARVLPRAALRRGP